MAFPRRPSAFLRYAIPAILLTLTFYLLTPPPLLSSRIGPLLLSTTFGRGRSRSHPATHPIDHLITAAEKEFTTLLSRETHTLAATAAAYRARRGRHPPPGFDKWYAFAKHHKAVIVEEFWDQIYHDLEPFWGVPPARIRRDARNFEMRIEVRGGKASTGSDWFWTQIWLEMVQQVEHMLPDMDLALNPMDEPRVVVEWEEVSALVKRAAKAKKMGEVGKVVEEWGELGEYGEGEGETEWEHEKHYWPIARRGCPPSSAARKAPVVTDFDRTPFIADPFSLPHMRDGYVANYTLSTDFCHQPDLQALEGIFVEPISVSSTRRPLPVFGGSKLAVNNEILLPAPMYWNEEERFTGSQGADIPWSSKHSSAIWRGVATGGHNRASNWRSFQRHRFVAMNNASLLAQAETNPDSAPPNFALPSKNYALLSTALPHHHSSNIAAPISAWLAPLANISLTDLMCSPTSVPPGSIYPPQDGTCPYTDPYFAPSSPIPMAEQFRHKYLPDIDGNSFSGRYLGFLRSTSLPIKATLFREWHDGRLVAWRHFVPMDARFGDWWGLLEYFLGDGKGDDGGGGGNGEEGSGRGRDEVAEGIAMAGREWAGRVLRREDMLVYVLRLLLEYGRVVRDGRERLGWVGDLRVEEQQEGG
ncbi:hypothetical protein VTI74DRAFT_4718 [Chaetomium olivicolor]